MFPCTIFNGKVATWAIVAAHRFSD